MSVKFIQQDPEDDDLPPKPQIFLRNLVDGIEKGATKKKDGATDPPPPPPPEHGSSSGAFLSHVITTIVAGVVR